MYSERKSVRFAVVGAGGFAYFAVSEFVKIPGVKLAGVYDEVIENSERFKGIEENLVLYSSLEELCAAKDIDLVYIATPPYLHYIQSKSALLSGKHVICEKPAAIQLVHAQELSEIAADRNLLFVVNLMQRYNYFFDAVRKIISENVLGNFLHGFFENYASDEFLKEDHWFWNEEKSGGIFIEHGVHFFDLFTGWLGEGQVAAAQKVQRKGCPGVWDKVHATVVYKEALVNFYHGFDQPKVMDRQEMRLLFEKGDLTLYEWVPTRLRLNALCNKEEIQFFKKLFPDALHRIDGNADEKIDARARFKSLRYNYKLNFDTGERIEKQVLYQNLVRDMFTEQLAWISDRKLPRRITDENAVSSLRMAEEAERLAVRFQ